MKNQLTGPELKKLRERVGVSSAAIARAAEGNSGMIWFFEHGKVKNPARLKEILDAYDHIDELAKPEKAAKEKKKCGRPGRPPKEKAKRKYVRKAKPEPEDGDEDPDAGLDDVMKTQLKNGKRGKRTPVAEEKPAALDNEWLKAQMENWTRRRRVVVADMSTPGEPEAPAKKFLVVTEAQVFDLGQTIMTACQRAKHPEASHE